jgi:putative nucleotidyltransferase with HDIG domain
MIRKWAFSDVHKEQIRLAVIVLVIALIALGHWSTPVAPHWLLGFHVLLRKMFLLPLLLAAVWYNLRGALLAALAVSLTYLPHVLIQWGSQSPEFVEQLGEFVTIWSTAILAGWLVDKEKSALRSLAQTHEGALVSLVMALDAREHDTQLHSLRVRAFAEHIATEMGMKGSALGELTRGALLHDIGKIGVPDSILLKKGALTPTERQIMQGHPEIGARILKNVPHTDGPATIVQCHHEKYDGSGYPQGLKGEEIPIGARIFAVADVFDALTSDRPYHDALAVSEAAAMIRSDAGSHFDPEVVDAFTNIPLADWQSLADDIEAIQGDPICMARRSGIGE